MPSVFTKIMQGKLPARIVYEDQACVAFLSIAPLRLGHTLVVPREEISHWIDLSHELLAHLIRIAQQIGKAQKRAFSCEKIGMIIAGFEVPHVHLHLVPSDDAQDLNFEHQNHHPSPKDLDIAASKIKESIHEILKEHPGEIF